MKRFNIGELSGNNVELIPDQNGALVFASDCEKAIIDGILFALKECGMKEDDAKLTAKQYARSVMDIEDDSMEEKVRWN